MRCALHRAAGPVISMVAWPYVQCLSVDIRSPSWNRVQVRPRIRDVNLHVFSRTRVSASHRFRAERKGKHTVAICCGRKGSCDAVLITGWAPKRSCATPDNREKAHTITAQHILLSTAAEQSIAHFVFGARARALPLAPTATVLIKSLARILHVTQTNKTYLTGTTWQTNDKDRTPKFPV